MSAIYIYFNLLPIFFGAFPVWNLKLVYLAISFSDAYFVVRGRFIQLKTTKQNICSKLACRNQISLCANCFLTLLLLSKLHFFKFVESFKGLFHHLVNSVFLICIRLRTTTTSNRIHPLNIRKREPYKNFKIFKKERYPFYTLQILQFI